MESKGRDYKHGVILLLALSLFSAFCRYDSTGTKGRCYAIDKLCTPGIAVVDSVGAQIAFGAHQARLDNSKG